MLTQAPSPPVCSVTASQADLPSPAASSLQTARSHPEPSTSVRAQAVRRKAKSEQVNARGQDNKRHKPLSRPLSHVDGH